MSASDYFVRWDLPVGLASDQPMPYGYRRWNDTVWCEAWTDRYNRLLERAVEVHRQGYDATGWVDALYRLSAQLDTLA